MIWMRVLRKWRDAAAIAILSRGILAVLKGAIYRRLEKCILLILIHID
jgi:hypothetical protein